MTFSILTCDIKANDVMAGLLCPRQAGVVSVMLSVNT